MQEVEGELKEREKPKVDSNDTDGRYKTLFEQVNAAAFLTSFEGQILEANHKSYELFGYGWNELLRLSLKDILPRDTDWDQLKDEIAAKGGLHIETDSITKDGRCVPAEISISLFKMSGKPVMFVLVWDITERKKAENRLRESEKKYRGLFEYTTDGTLVLDARGDILDVNTKICEMLDFSKDALVGKNLFNTDLLTATALPLVVNQFEQLLSEKTANTYTTEVKDKQGTVLNVEVSSFFLVKKDNEVDNFVLIIRDITKRNAYDKKRIHEHGLLKTLLDNIPDSVYFKDGENRFILVNKTKADHSNVSPEEIIGKTDFDFLPENQAQRIYDDEKSIIDSGQPIVNKEEIITHNDGSKRWVSVTKIPRFNAEGDIIGTMGISRDITKRKKTEKELERNHSFLMTLMETIQYPLYFKDDQNRFVLVNKATADQWNVNAESMIGKTDFDFLPQEKAQKTFDDENKILQTGKSIVDNIEEVTGSDGLDQWFSITKVPIYDNENKIIGTIGICLNVTELKKIEGMKKEKDGQETK